MPIVWPMPVRPCAKSWLSPKSLARVVDVYTPGPACDAAAPQACGVPACDTRSWRLLVPLGAVGVFEELPGVEGAAVPGPVLGPALDVGVCLRSIECSVKRPSMPTTPVTSPANDEGTCGDVVLTTAREPPAGCTCSRGVPKAVDTTAVVPLTGSKTLPSSGVPTVRPSLRNADDTCTTVDDAGPYAEANCAGVR